MVLTGLKVVDFSAFISGPATAGILADWGADVIKVERPTGDAMRYAFRDAGIDVANPSFELDNRGKRGVVLDIAKTGGRDALVRLAAQADVFLTNVRTKSLRKYGLDYESLKVVNPRLVYAVITGYGSEGPAADLAGFDVTAFWARGGVAAQTAPKGSEPFMPGAGIGDHAASVATVGAILAALYERQTTGVGRLVETSLLATGIYLTGTDLAVQLKFGRLSSVRPRHQPMNPLSNYFRSRDGKWFVHNDKGGGRGWQRLAEAADRADLLIDERFKTGKGRRENAQALTAELDAGFAQLDGSEIARRLDEADLAWANLQSPSEVAEDPQVAASGAIVMVDDGLGGIYRAPAAPANFPETVRTVLRPAPQLGQHSREVLAQVGYNDDEIDDLFADQSTA